MSPGTLYLCWWVQWTFNKYIFNERTNTCLIKRGNMASGVVIRAGSPASFRILIPLISAISNRRYFSVLYFLDWKMSVRRITTLEHRCKEYVKQQNAWHIISAQMNVNYYYYCKWEKLIKITVDGIFILHQSKHIHVLILEHQ